MITAVVVEGRRQAEVAEAYGVSLGWVNKLVARYRAEGEEAYEPRSRRPKRSPRAISDDTVELIVWLRKDLEGQGLDAGPDTTRWHLAHHHGVKISASTISRYLARQGLVTPQPRKRPKASYIRFQAELPNECWQADFTHVDTQGRVTLRHNGRLHHIGVGRTHARTPIIMLIADLHTRIIATATGELLRTLTLNPTRDYQPTGRPPGPPPRKQQTPQTQ